MFFAFLRIDWILNSFKKRDYCYVWLEVPMPNLKNDETLNSHFPGKLYTEYECELGEGGGASRISINIAVLKHQHNCQSFQI